MLHDELVAWARNWHWNDCADDKPVDPSIYFRDMRMLKAFIIAAESYRAAEKRKNCKHTNKRGSGSLSSDGSGSTRWFCMDCGHSYSEEFPPRPAGAPVVLMNAPVSAAKVTGE